jgi:hypothetical protein
MSLFGRFGFRFMQRGISSKNPLFLLESCSQISVEKAAGKIFSHEHRHASCEAGNDFAGQV